MASCDTESQQSRDEGIQPHPLVCVVCLGSSACLVEAQQRKCGKYARNFEHTVCVGVRRLQIVPRSRCQITVFMLK